MFGLFGNKNKFNKKDYYDVWAMIEEGNKQKILDFKNESKAHDKFLQEVYLDYKAKQEVGALDRYEAEAYLDSQFATYTPSIEQQWSEAIAEMPEYIREHLETFTPREIEKALKLFKKKKDIIYILERLGKYDLVYALRGTLQA